MSTTWPLELPGVKPATDKVSPKPAVKIKTAAIPKTDIKRGDNAANAMLAADAAAALSMASGKRITTGEVLLRSSLPIKNSTQRRGKI